MSKKIFLACPVRGHDPKQFLGCATILEGDGFTVYWPPRDTNQDDSTGLRICKDNLRAIKEANVIYAIWDGKSQGVLFDLGMAFALNKKVVALRLPSLTDGKSFQNMITAWVKEEKE